MQIGEKIKQLRIQHQLTQEELGDRCELTKGFISQLERDLTSPSIATLIDILECLGTNLQDFFNESIQEKIVFTGEDTFVKQDDEAGTTIQWLIPNSQKNEMEPIMVTLEPGGETWEDMPHTGEEFGHILQGSVLICIGSERLRARKGDSFCFKPNKPHKLMNPGKTKAVVIWVATPPSF